MENPIKVHTFNGYIKVGNTQDNPEDESFIPEAGTMRFNSSNNKF